MVRGREEGFGRYEEDRGALSGEVSYQLGDNKRISNGTILQLSLDIPIGERRGKRGKSGEGKGENDAWVEMIGGGEVVVY